MRTQNTRNVPTTFKAHKFVARPLMCAVYSSVYLREDYKN